MELDLTQRQAVTACLDGSKRLVPVTGPAGTGKTTIIRHVGNTLREAGYKVEVCAPTGKAARRIKEATGLAARTIHMLLEYPRPGDIDPKTGKSLDTTSPKRNQRFPLEADVILADEYAMVNQELHRSLVNAMKPGARLCLFGDIHQLPPIESDLRYKSEPSAFSTMLKKFNGYHLKTIHRQGEGSVIVSNGERVLNGFSPIQHDDFKMIFTTNQVGRLVDRVMELTEEGVDFTKLQAQVLTPMKIGPIGAFALNSRLQQLLEAEWEHDQEIALPRHTWEEKWPIKVRPGTKVIITRNLYEIYYENSPEDKGVFNGETGIILGLDTDGINLRLDLGDRIAIIPPEITQINSNGKVYTMHPWKDIQLAYCTTTHKAQGSEFQHVVYVMGRSAYKMLNRANLYTALTRARKAVTLVTDQDGLSVSLRTKQAAL